MSQQLSFHVDARPVPATSEGRRGERSRLQSQSATPLPAAAPASGFDVDTPANGMHSPASLSMLQLGDRTYDPSKNSFLSPDLFQEETSGEDLFLQTDPLTENAYTFVDGDPMNQFDPSGHMYTCGNDCPAGGADHAAAIQQTTHSYYATHAAAADKQQAVGNRENARCLRPLRRRVLLRCTRAWWRRRAVRNSVCRSGWTLEPAWQNKFAIGAGALAVGAVACGREPRHLCRRGSARLSLLNSSALTRRRRCWRRPHHQEMR